MERAAQHALALVVPGACYAAKEEEPPRAAPGRAVAPATAAAAAAAAAVAARAKAAAPRYLIDAAPDAAASLVIALPVSQRAAYRMALDRLKRRWHAVDC